MDLNFNITSTQEISEQPAQDEEVFDLEELVLLLQSQHNQILERLDFLKYELSYRNFRSSEHLEECLQSKAVQQRNPRFRITKSDIGRLAIRSLISQMVQTDFEHGAIDIRNSRINLKQVWKYIVRSAARLLREETSKMR